MITGQIFFRDADMKAPDGRRLMMFVGVVAIDDSVEMLSERQCVVVGEITGDINFPLRLHIDTPGDDMTHNVDFASQKIGDILLRPVWRV